MSGDGLTDIVRVRNGEACYWPNTGYGRFGAKVTMDDAPRFDDEERFDPRRIRLADIDGSGTADLLYIGEDGVTAWFNQSGNAWSAPTAIARVPLGRPAELGPGRSTCSAPARPAWSGPRRCPADAAAPLLYVDLMGGRKPHLMTGARNNLGAETRVSYAPVDPLLRGRRDRGHARGSPGCRSRCRSWSESRRSTGSAGTGSSPATPTTTATSTGTSASSAASAWSSSGTPRSSAPTPAFHDGDVRQLGRRSPGHRRCSPGPGSTPARSFEAPRSQPALR